MSKITTWVEEYAAGDLDRADLVKNLVGFSYKEPGRFETIPADIFEADAQAEDRRYDYEGTMNEVNAAQDRGLIDGDLVIEVLEGIEKAAEAEG